MLMKVRHKQGRSRRGRSRSVCDKHIVVVVDVDVIDTDVGSMMASTWMMATTTLRDIMHVSSLIIYVNSRKSMQALCKVALLG
jgi:hypothetical protein